MDITETRAWHVAREAAREQRIEQRKLVMRYPDIAARLCSAPLKYAKPEQWTGYIPPAYDGEREDGTTPVNTSPVRVQLMALLEEAAERSDGERRAA